jgi:hypothetical protein
MGTILYSELLLPSAGAVQVLILEVLVMAQMVVLVVVRLMLGQLVLVLLVRAIVVALQRIGVEIMVRAAAAAQELQGAMVLVLLAA